MPDYALHYGHYAEETLKQTVVPNRNAIMISMAWGVAVASIDAAHEEPFAYLWVTVSPKIDMPGKLPILPEAMAGADEIKHVVGRQRDIEQVDDLLAKCHLKEDVTICLQPISQSEKATFLAIDMAKERN